MKILSNNRKSDCTTIELVRCKVIDPYSYRAEKSFRRWAPDKCMICGEELPETRTADSVLTCEIHNLANTTMSYVEHAITEATRGARKRKLLLSLHGNWIKRAGTRKLPADLVYWYSRWLMADNYANTGRRR